MSEKLMSYERVHILDEFVKDYKELLKQLTDGQLIQLQSKQKEVHGEIHDYLAKKSSKLLVPVTVEEKRALVGDNPT